MDIKYDGIDFPDPLPNGLKIPTSASLSARPARLAWAAATVGYSPYGPAVNRRIGPLELQWRTAMIRASLSPTGGIFRRSASYQRLDPSEKAALSFFLGQAQAKLFAHDIFRISRFVHYDKYLQHKGIRHRKTRPDFLGFRGDGTAIAVEAKGRSGLWTEELAKSAKDQVMALPAIAGYTDPIRYAHLAFFDHGEWRARLIDPPSQRNTEEADPALLTLDYYGQIVAAVLGGGNSQEPPVEGNDGNRYLQARFPNIDASILVREDIASRTAAALEDTPDGRTGAPARSVLQLYELTFELESREPYSSRGALADENSFIGDDGVGVELGRSWTNWS